MISENQFGFRRGHSSCYLTSLLTDQIATSFEEKMNSLGSFLDLSKAFDTINHKILLNKLYHCGVRGTVHDWYKSYLFGKTQQIDYNSSVSNLEPISSSVPQGQNVSNIATTCLLLMIQRSSLVQKNNNLLFQKGNKELEHIDNWLIANKLSLNIKKNKIHFI